MNKEILITALILIVIYQYLQQRKLNKDNLSKPTENRTVFELGNEEELSQKITSLEQDCKQKEQTIIGLNNSYEKLDKKYEELKKSKTNSLSEQEQEKLQEYDNLETEKDQLKRENLTLEQEITARGNQLKLKNQEVSKKEQEISRLKQEKNTSEISLNKKIKELKSDLEDYKKEWNQKKAEYGELKTKYSKQAQLLDTEQLECKKLAETNEKLTEDFQKSKSESENLVKSLQEDLKVTKQREKYRLDDFQTWINANKEKYLKLKQIDCNAFSALYLNWEKVIRGQETGTLRQEMVNEWKKEVDKNYLPNKEEQEMINIISELTKGMADLNKELDK